MDKVILYLEKQINVEQSLRIQLLLKYAIPKTHTETIRILFLTVRHSYVTCKATPALSTNFIAYKIITDVYSSFKL